jgi:two-component system, NtrC family, sensor kinase
LQIQYLSFTMRILPIAFIFFLLLSAVGPIQAQSPQIDSLNTLIRRTVNDTARMDLVIQKAKILGAINIDSSIALGESALKQAAQIGYLGGQFRIMWLLIRGYSLKGDRIKARQMLSMASRNLSASADSILYGVYYGNFGCMYCIEENDDSAIYLLTRSIGIIERNGYALDLGRFYSELGNSYRNKGNYHQALQLLQSALVLYEREKDEYGKAVALVNVAAIYNDLNELEKSAAVYENAMELAEKNHFLNVTIYCTSNLASLALSNKTYELCVRYATKAAALAATAGDQSIRAASLSKAARALYFLNHIPEALEMGRQAIAVADSSSQPFVQLQAYSAFASFRMRQHQYKAAIMLYEKGISLSKSDFYNSVTGDAYEDLSAAYLAIGQPARALVAFQKFDQIKDSIRSKENIEKGTKLSMNDEFDKKQAVARIEQDKLNAVASRIKNQQVFAILVLGIVVLAVVIIALIQFRNNRHKQKANKQLGEQNARIEKNLVELRSMQTQLIQQEKMASLGELTAGIAHEIQNPLNFVNNFADLNRELIDELVAERGKPAPSRDEAMENDLISDIKANDEKISQHGQRAAAIVKGMLQHSRKGSGQMEATNINSLCDEFLALAYLGWRAKEKDFFLQINKDFDEGIGQVRIIPQDIGRVLLNLFNNAFYAVAERKKKYAVGYEPTLTVTTKKSGSMTHIIISDNGMGIPAAIKNKVFQPFYTTKPTGLGTGLGLSLSYDIIKSHGGAIELRSDEGVGTQFVISIPTS